MKKIIAAIIALCLLSGCAAPFGKTSSHTAPTVIAEVVSVGKTDAKISVTTDSGTDIIQEVGYVLYNMDGSKVGSGTVDSTSSISLSDLREGMRYDISVWVTAYNQKYVCKEQQTIDTKDKYDKILGYGIDVSKWQKNINWAQVANAEISGSKLSFAMLRIGYTGGIDDKFEEYYAGAKSVGLNVGGYVYCYATTPEQAKADAEMVIGTLAGRKFDYPIFYDIEDEDKINALSNEQRAALVKAFCDEIEAAGYKAGAYMCSSWLYDCFDGNMMRDNYDLWLAETVAEVPQTSSYEILQYSHTGSVSGISGNVDLDTVYVEY